MTTRGFEEKEAATVAHLVAGVLEAPDDAAAITRVAGKVESLCDDFPVLQRLSFLRMRLECR